MKQKVFVKTVLTAAVVSSMGLIALSGCSKEDAHAVVAPVAHWIAESFLLELVGAAYDVEE